MKYQSFVINIINLFGLYISDSQIRSTTEKGPKYRFPVQIDLQKCRKKLQDLLMNFIIVGVSDSMLRVML